MYETKTIAKRVVESAGFLEMPASAQILYFHLITESNCKGVVIAPKAVARSCGSNAEDIEMLFSRGFIGCFGNDGSIEIVHWQEHIGTGETARERNSHKYRMWRKSVIERDHRCVKCGSTCNLEAHHIKPFSKFPEYRFDIDNGITLCKKCHIAEHKKMRGEQ